MSNIKLYDTVKDKKNVRYCVMDVDGDNVKIVQLVDTGAGVKVKGGRPRTIKKQDIGTEYTMLNFPPVEVSHIEKNNHPTDIDVLRDECISLKKENEQLHEKIANSAQEVTDLKKTINKMKQSHEAEVADLKDRIMEAEAEANAIRKSKDDILKDRVQYADALDNDSIAFEEILQLAVLMERGAKSMHEVSKMIQAKTEGRV